MCEKDGGKEHTCKKDMGTQFTCEKDRGITHSYERGGGTKYTCESSAEHPDAIPQSGAYNEDDEGTGKGHEDTLPAKTDVQNKQESTHGLQADGTLYSTSSVRSVGQRDAHMQHPINLSNSNGKVCRSKKRKRKKSYMCEVCGFSTRYPASFINHRRIHTGEKPYKCDSCDYRTINSSRLSVHKMRNHLNNDSEEAKPFLCDICGVRKRRAGDLREHKVTHTGEKRFKCRFVQLQGDMCW